MMYEFTGAPDDALTEAYVGRKILPADFELLGAGQCAAVLPESRLSVEGAARTSALDGPVTVSSPARDDVL